MVTGVLRVSGLARATPIVVDPGSDLVAVKPECGADFDEGNLLGAGQVVQPARLKLKQFTGLLQSQKNRNGGIHLAGSFGYASHRADKKIAL